ncbi:MAG: nucleotidyltransferase domain-containing protein [Prosthecobacter sp.]|jgi:predicted nucleotidyltransferase/predicted enzyme related to lactoylglutathione lyase|uniref:DNA polymerase beta superfamily protein n=1 Tax=Prosthecobacter sp. TaxID=1965333 RepID=UPI0019DD995B|nr:nucleotidyltransferase domain-containing protein [Prosthecobacter sp.]MBE2286476.1 nucleotidyltransferase domain-containing protein [Prosthecobacter sp.]
MSHQPHNIHAGTQIVTKVGVHGSNNALVHSRGAVGIVTRTPCGHEQHFLVRFPDGFEASLLREELEVLKLFKDRLDPAGAHDFDLEEHVIYRCIVGSRAYGLDTEASDTDLRGIYLAPADLQWSLYGAPEQFEDNATQSCYWELQKFLVMALKANPNILECLYSPLVDKVTPIGERLLAIRDRFLSQMIFQTFNGYALSQFKKIEQDLRNHGEVRWKHAMHLLRLLMTGAATLREGRVPVHVGPHRDELLAVKRGELTWDKVDAWRQELHHDFELALAETKLPERPDYEAANGLLLTARNESAKPLARSSTSLRLVVLQTSDLERAAAFYRCLGLQLVRHKHGNGPEHFAAETLTGVFERYPLSKDGSSALGARIGFQVASVDAVIARVMEHSPAIITAPHDSEWGRRAVIADPDGHRVELTEQETL